jgi:hypothetical protein
VEIHRLEIMKSFVVAALAGVTLASPHALLKRETVIVDETVTVTVCALGHSILPESECNAGIANGTLRWADESQTKVTVNLVGSPLH